MFNIYKLSIKKRKTKSSPENIYVLNKTLTMIPCLKLVETEVAFHIVFAFFIVTIL